MHRWHRRRHSCHYRREDLRWLTTLWWGWWRGGEEETDGMLLQKPILIFYLTPTIAVRWKLGLGGCCCLNVWRLPTLGVQMNISKNLHSKIIWTEWRTSGKESEIYRHILPSPRTSRFFICIVIVLYLYCHQVEKVWTFAESQNGLMSVSLYCHRTISKAFIPPKWCHGTILKKTEKHDTHKCSFCWVLWFQFIFLNW